MLLRRGLGPPRRRLTKVRDSSLRLSGSTNRPGRLGPLWKVVTGLHRLATTRGSGWVIGGEIETGTRFTGATVSSSSAIKEPLSYGRSGPAAAAAARPVG